METVENQDEGKSWGTGRDHEHPIGGIFILSVAWDVAVFLFSEAILPLLRAFSLACSKRKCGLQIWTPSTHRRMTTSQYCPL